MEQAFHSGRISVDKKQAEKLGKTVMYRQRRSIIAVERKTHHTAKFTGKSIPDNRNDTHRTQRNQRKRYAVITRNNHEIRGFVLDDVVHLGNISRSLLYRHDIIEIASQTQGRLGRHIHTSTTGYIIEDNRQFSC